MSATTQTIIAARVEPLRYPHARVCADCGGLVTHRALRVAVKHDGRVSVVHYHPHVDEDLEQRACAPDHPLVRAALRRRAAPATMEDAS